MKPAKFYGRRTKIVCTLGPATGSTAMVERLLRAGMNIARLNLAHGTYREHIRYIQTVRKLAQRLSIPVAILMDFPGSKNRTGMLRGGSAMLKRGAEIVLTTKPVEGDEKRVPVKLTTFPQEVKVGDTVLLDDGALQLKVQDIGKTEVRCKVIVGGLLTPGRGIVVPGMRDSGPFITDHLCKHLAFAVQQQPDYIALSFVSSEEDIGQVRVILQEKGCEIPIIAKIERGQAVARFDKILAASDGIMVARGDLGVDIPLQRIPLVQKGIIRKCNQAAKPVITATQMLESMVTSVRPTRAEVTDVANAIFDGTDAVMLSAETSVGNYPAEAVRMMAKIVHETESKLPYENLLVERGTWLELQTDELISYNACHTASRLGAAAIVAFTKSGSTAQRVSKYRPRMPILAITSSELICRRLLLYWGVQGLQITKPSSVGELFTIAARLSKDLGLAKSGDLIIITGGIPIGVAGTTNLLKVEQIP